VKTDTSEAGLETLIVTAITGPATPMAGDQGCEPATFALAFVA